MTAPPRKTAAKKTTPSKMAAPDRSGFEARQAEEYTPPILAEPKGGPIPAYSPRTGETDSGTAPEPTADPPAKKTAGKMPPAKDDSTT